MLIYKRQSRGLIISFHLLHRLQRHGAYLVRASGLSAELRLMPPGPSVPATLADNVSAFHFPTPSTATAEPRCRYFLSSCLPVLQARCPISGSPAALGHKAGPEQAAALTPSFPCTPCASDGKQPCHQPSSLCGPELVWQCNTKKDSTFFSVPYQHTHKLAC